MDNHHGDIKKLPQRIEILTSKGELSDVRGTVKYSGLVDGTEGDWYGIEWDDISRGKHSGEKEGKQFFETIFPNSATFVRPSKKIHTGQSFLEAFRNKYSYSNDALEFAPNIDRITKKLSQTDQLKVVSVEHMAVYGINEEEKENTKQEAKSIRQLSVAHSLISNIEDVDNLVECLPNLQELDLSSNRIRIVDSNYSNICQLKSLKLNNTLIDYQQITQIHRSLSFLEELELAYNNIISLTTSCTLGNLQILSLSHNKIHEWDEIERMLINLPNLHTLKLNNNTINSISYPTSNVANTRLKTLILSHNPLDTWKSIDALSLRFTQLESLSLTDCPIMNHQVDVGISRQNVIARFEKLETLNLSEVSIDERKDAEYFYIRNPPTEEDPKRARYQFLCQKYDYQPSVQPVKKLTHLQLKKLNIDVCMDSKTYPLTTISSITIKKLRLIIKRLFGLPTSNFKLIASMIPPPNMFGVVDEERTDVVLDDDYKDLRWFSVENGDHIVVHCD